MFGKISNSVELGCQYLQDYVKADPSLLKFSRLMAEEIDDEVFEMFLNNSYLKIEFDDANCLATEVENIYLANVRLWNRAPNSANEFRRQMSNLRKLTLLIDHGYIPDSLFNDAFFDRIWLEWDYRMDLRVRKFAQVWQNVYYMTRGNEGLFFE